MMPDNQFCKVYSSPMIPRILWFQNILDFHTSMLTTTSIGELFLDNDQLYTRHICHNKKVKDFGKYSFPIYNK